MKMVLFWGAIGLLATVPLYFIWNQVYKDGVIGRAALLFISGCAWGTIIDAAIGEQATKYDPSPPGVGLALGTAVFFIWHLWSFHRRVERRDKGACPPDCPQDRRRLHDRRYVSG